MLYWSKGYFLIEIATALSGILRHNLFLRADSRIVRRDRAGWERHLGRPAGERRPIDEGDPGALIDQVIARVKALIERFDDPSTPYLAVPSPLWAPRFSDYRHLERLAENEAEE